MASPLPDDTLGEKHRHHNKLVNDAVKKNVNQQITAINYEEPDMNNLYKIDIACYNRNVEYILEALKCEDMLYVSRVIKRSTWLITDPQYSYIINPEYLHDNLHPKMTSQAFNKLILHVRLNLEDEKRVEAFFNYYKEDLQKAFKWLPGCSISFIENIIRKHGVDIPKKIMLRLHRKSITCLEILIRCNSESYLRLDYLQDAKFLLKSNVEKFLDIIEEANLDYGVVNFGPKLTRRVMETKPDRIMKKLEKYFYYLDLSTFANFIKVEDVADFILTMLKNKETRNCFNHNNIKHFVDRLPIEQRFNFVQKYFIEKSYEDEGDLKGEKWDDIVRRCCPLGKGSASSWNVYSWYVYAPFTRALEDLKPLIRNEPNPAERNEILRVLLTCAGSDQKNILTLLKYYREYHINEPFMFKIQFVNCILTNTDTHNFDKEAWGYLNDLFNSMEVYIESEKSVQTCVKAIILRNIINGEKVPEIIENKFEFENLDGKNKFNLEERKKIFDFLYNYLISKINTELKTEKDFDETVEIILKVLNLLKEWNKELQEFPFIIQKIKNLIALRKENSWKGDLSSIYNVKKSWRKHLLAESIPLSSTEDSCINALKHDPKLLEIYIKEIIDLCMKNVLFKRFLKKIRIYWYQSLADSFKSSFLENVYKKHSHVALIKGLCMLFSQQEILNFINKHAPKETKIDWSQPSELELNVCKYVAKSMHLARPQPPLAVVLLYAKGDYMQYALPSLDAILYNTKSTVFCKHIAELLDSPVSLQKHCIRAAFAKLKYDELTNIFSNIWESTKNSTIRCEIFYHTYKRLCKEGDESIIFQIWQLLNMFIEKLTFEENKKIYVTLSKHGKVPLSVRAAFWMKSYDFLKKLPAKDNSSMLIDGLFNSDMDDIMEFLDVDFMAKIFFEDFDNKFGKKPYDYSSKLASYLLSTKTEAAQKERYEKILEPLIEKALMLWDKQYENIFFARYNLQFIFNFMSSGFQDVVLNQEMVFPIALLSGALNKLQDILSYRDNYILLTNIKLSLAYIKIIHDLKRNKEEEALSFDLNESVDLKQEDKWKNLHNDAAPIFGRICLDYLMEDVAKYFPSVSVMFAYVLEVIFYWYITKPINVLRVLKVFVDKKDFIQGQLLVMKSMPHYLPEDDEKALRREMVNELSSHPSEEVVMHYWYFRKKEYQTELLK